MKVSNAFFPQGGSKKVSDHLNHLMLFSISIGCFDDETATSAASFFSFVKIFVLLDCGRSTISLPSPPPPVVKGKAHIQDHDDDGGSLLSSIHCRPIIGDSTPF